MNSITKFCGIAISAYFGNCTALADGFSATFRGLGTLPGGAYHSEANAVSADGKVVVGWSSSSAGTQAFRWTSDGGMKGLGTLPSDSASSVAYAVSADGAVIVGQSSSAHATAAEFVGAHSFSVLFAPVTVGEAFRWTPAGGIQGLGFLSGESSYSAARGVSADGNLIVGWSVAVVHVGSTTSRAQHAYRWSLGTGLMDSGGLSALVAQSGVGEVAAGIGLGAQYKGLVWSPNRGYGLVDFCPPGSVSFCYGVSFGGRFVVGGAYGSCTDGAAFLFDLNSTKSTQLPLASGSVNAHGYAVSDDGNVVVGDLFPTGAFLWQPCKGSHNLQDLLSATGSLPSGWNLTTARGLSKDGLTIVGSATNPQGNTEAYILNLVPNAATLKVFDANPLYLGSVFLTGSRFPLDPRDPRTPSAMQALALADTTRQGLVADATTQLLIRFEADVPGRVTFMQSNPAAGFLTSIDGTPSVANVPTTPLAGKQMAFALFNAPDQMNTTTLADMVQASFVPVGWTGQPINASASITVKRPPVVLVHGLWGDPGTWKVLEPQLNALGFKMAKVNYRPWFSASGRFADYRGMVRDEATKLIFQMRSDGFAATRVDVVAHSMGGILARLDANDQLSKSVDNNYQGYFRRLVTIDTPHFGSRAATVLLGLAAAKPDFGTFLASKGHPLQGGVADLSPGTFAQSVSPPGSGLLIEATRLPAFAICCTVDSQDDLLPFYSPEFLIYFLAKWNILKLNSTERQNLLCGQSISAQDSEFSLANKVFTTSSAMPHDGIVPVSSQKGGCKSFTVISGVRHTAAPADAGVDQFLTLLLTGDSNVFDSNGFPAVSSTDVQAQWCGPSLSQPVPDTPASLVQLSFLQNPSTHPGSSVGISVQSIAGAAIDDLLVIASQGGSTIASAESTNLPFQFTFTTPTNALGPISIVALAANSHGQTDFQTTNVVLQPGVGTGLKSIAVAPDSFTLTGIGQVGQLALIATYADGSSFDVTRSENGTVYSSSIPGIASMDSSGLLTAVGQGTTSVTVQYGTLETNIPVKVSLQSPVVLSAAPRTAVAGALGVPFALIGSGFGGASKVEYFRNGLLEPAISASNLVVGAGGLNLSGVVNVSTNVLPGMRTVAVTTPAGRSSIDSAQGNRLLVGGPLEIDGFAIRAIASDTTQIHLHIAGPPGGVCVLQSSTNLVNWTAVATNNLLGGEWFFGRFLPALSTPLFFRAENAPYD